MDNEPTPPVPPSPEQPQAAWVPQDPAAGQPVAAVVPKKGLPLILKIMIGCGALFFLVPFLLVIVLVAINPVDKIQEAKEKAEQTAKTTTSSASKTANAKTINGQFKKSQGTGNYRFQISVPSDFTEEQTSDYEFIAKNKEIQIRVGVMEGPNIYTNLSGRADEEDLCPSPLTVISLTSNTRLLEACNIIKIDGRSSLFLITTYPETFEACNTTANLFVVRKIDSYSNAIFKADLDELNEAIKPYLKYKNLSIAEACPDEAMNAVKTNLESSVKKIESRQNLTARDTKTLDDLDQIISTFKLL